MTPAGGREHMSDEHGARLKADVEEYILCKHRHEFDHSDHTAGIAALDRLLAYTAAQARLEALLDHREDDVCTTVEILYGRITKAEAELAAIEAERG